MKKEVKEEKKEAVEEVSKEPSKEVNKEENKDVVFIGGKPFMNYVNAVEWQLKEFAKVTIRARGKHTGRAIDVSQVMENRYDCKIGEIKLSSEEFTNKEGRKVRVSALDIEVIKESK